MPAWLPNAISIVRVGLVPLWLFLAERHRDEILAGGEGSATALLIVLAALGFSDLIDGWLARRFGLATPLGAVLDASADKLAQVAIYTWLAFRDAPGLHPVPLWFWILLPLRDLILLSGWVRIHRLRGRVDSTHRWHGKAASLLLFLFVIAILMSAPGASLDLGFVLIALFVSGSTLAYVLEGRRQVKDGGGRGRAP